MNNVSLIGNLTREVELKYFPSGKTYAILGLANNRKYKKGEEIIEKTLFIDVRVIGEMSNVCQKYLTKGSRIAVSGVLEQETWEDKETGQKRSKVVIFAENIQFLDSKKKEGIEQIEQEENSTQLC